MKGKSGLIIIGIFAILFMWGCSGYNGMVKKDEDVKKAWGDVQVQYQRRADVIINLMETVKGAAANEKDILTAVTNARAGISSAKDAMGHATTPSELDGLLAKVQAQASSIRVTLEAYPQIRSTEAFLKFQDEIAGTENRISTVRSDYNAVVAAYNKSVRSFPNNILAGMFSFAVKEEFKAKAGSENAPAVDFTK